jgi:hypothetical protein
MRMIASQVAAVKARVAELEDQLAKVLAIF